MFYRPGSWRKEKECKICGKKGVDISEVIGVCVNCLREDPGDALKIAIVPHKKSREMFNLPLEPPRDPSGLRCGLCDLDCRIPKHGKGFCGLVENRDGRIRRYGGTPVRGVVEWYYDPLPTNCVAWWFCPGCTGLGYPKYAYRRGAERGYYNLAVFYGACNLDCLFCQNWTHKKLVTERKAIMSSEELASKADWRVTCICFFGGDPSPQVIHAISTARIALRKAGEEKRVLRICWETNGHFNPKIMKVVSDLSLVSGGIVKFDLKAWTSSVYKALTGIDIGKVYDNAKYVLERAPERPEVPLFTASTLLVPGYVDEYEVREIARFLASFDRDTPYTLLAFHPDYMLSDLPPTSRRHAKKALNAAREEGLRRINIGNQWLLGDYY